MGLISEETVNKDERVCLIAEGYEWHREAVSSKAALEKTEFCFGNRLNSLVFFFKATQ